MSARLIVAGGGLVGTALACAARGFEVRVLEAAPERPPLPAEGFDTRIYALSGGSRAFLRDLGVWERLDAARVAPVRRMEVFGDGGARIAFSGRAGSALAWIAESGRLAAALEEEAASLAGVEMRRGAEVSACGASESLAWVELAGGERLEADLLVGADGPDSRVRALLKLPADERPYAETALVANFEAEREHGDTARQWFREEGVLAWLPLPGRRISIVWSCRDPLGEELARLEPEAFATRVRDAGGAALGDLKLISTIGRFPLRLIVLPRTVAPGAALVGDAAHAVHPLAGQGVNLGFQDARVLAEVLARRSPVERPGDLRVLRRYARTRREDVTAMQYVTDGLDRLFRSDAPGAAAFRNLGLKLVDSQGWAKDALAGRAMR